MGCRMSMLQKTAIERRTTEFEIEPMIVGRWSPRAMSGERLAESDFMRLFEAARWAPSSGNRQPWRFAYARRGTPPWERFLGLLDEGNRVWASAAAALIVVASRTVTERDRSPARTHAFDTGAAWQNLALQGASQGLVVHGMAGFDYDRAREVARVPAEYDVQAMVAVGVPGDPDALPERLRKRETPSARRPVREFAFEGAFPP
jgi:nitroreductase